MSFLKPALLFTFLIAGIAACSSADDAQREFEQEAFQPPSGFTKTGANGEIIENDPKDWRVSPLFSGFVDVIQPAYPNPTTGQTVEFQILITGLDSVNGLEVATIDDNNRFKVLYFDERRPLPIGSHSITFNPVLFAPGQSGTISGARGLHRVFVFDHRDNLITYGDVKVE